MPVDQQSDEPIPMPMPVLSQCGQELGHFRFGQVLTHPVSIVSLTPCRCDWSHNSRSDELEPGRFHGPCPPVGWFDWSQNNTESDQSLAQSTTDGQRLAPA